MPNSNKPNNNKLGGDKLNGDKLNGDKSSTHSNHRPKSQVRLSSPKHRSPMRGLRILEALYQEHPNNLHIKHQLIRAYILLDYPDKASVLIDTLGDTTNTQSLKLKSWQANQQGDLPSQQSHWQQILAQDYVASVHAVANNLHKISQADIKICPTDVVVFTQVYNEMLRLPNFLQHYRKLGATCFFVIDNDSTDNCQEFLLQQSDVHVFWTNDSHTQAGEGMVWYQKLIDRYLCGNWLVVADADELLVYPNCETVKLLQLVDFLDKKGCCAMTSFMLDMFPTNLKAQLDFQATDDLLQQSPYFYNHYRQIGHIDPPYFDIKGGIFYYLGQFLPPLIKVPLIKTASDVKYIQTHHRITPTKVAPITSAVLHFKFLGDFYQKSLVEQQAKRHFAGAVAYRQYAKMYDIYGDDKFDFTSLDKAVKYQNSQQLVQLGLIKTSLEWENYCIQYHNQ